MPIRAERPFAFAIFAFALALAFAHAGCKRSEPSTERVWDVYDGSAPYPNLRPKLVLPKGAFALVPNSGGDTLALIDLERGSVIGVSPVGRDPVNVDGPHQVVVDRRRGVAFTVLSYPGSAAAAGQHSHGASNVPGWVQVLALDDLRAVGEQRVDPNPGEIVLSDDGERLVVSHFDLKAAAANVPSIDNRRSTLAVIDPKTIEAFGTPEPDKLLVCVAPHGLTLSRGGGAKAFVACYGEDAVAIVDLADTHAPVVRVPVSAGVALDPPPGPPRFGPYAVALSWNGWRLAVSNRDAKDVRFLAVGLGSIPPKMESLVISVDGAPYFSAWSPDDARLYVPTRARDAITAYDTTNGKRLLTRVFDAATCVQPLEAIVGEGGLFLVCEGDEKAPGVVLTLDFTTLEVRARTVVGRSPGRSFVGRGP